MDFEADGSWNEFRKIANVITFMKLNDHLDCVLFSGRKKGGDFLDFQGSFGRSRFDPGRSV